MQNSQRRFTVVSTGQLALNLDEVQYSEHHGPCLHAAITGKLIEIRDTRTETWWPDYAQRAAAHRNFSSLSVPLAIDEDVSGALKIYAADPTPSTTTPGRRPSALGPTRPWPSGTCTSTRTPTPWPAICRPLWSPGRLSTGPRAS